MKAHQLIAALSPALKLEITSYLQKETREAYRTSLYSLAAQRKLRPQYIQAKSREQQGEWLMEQLKLRTNDGVGEQLLQLWLLKAKTPMLVAFLDAAGIKHDGEGQVDDLPEVLTKEQVDAGIDAMLKDHPAEHIAIYFRLFQLQRPEGWPAIAEALEKRSELNLG
ncbi:hypothetical protein BH11VER1_BH11VER1_29510 [soil metagenome]